MNSDRLQRLLDDPELARLWLAGLGVRDLERSVRDLRDLAARTTRRELLSKLLERLEELLPACPDPGMAFSNIERFLATEGPEGEILSFLTEHPRHLEVVVQLFSTSQHFTEMMIRDPMLLSWLRRGADRRDRAALVAALWDQVKTLDDHAGRLALRRFRRQELLRIGYNDIVRGIPLETTTLDLSHLADACVECAYRMARNIVETRCGEAVARDGHPARFVVLALGKLGGEELNYSSDIDLVFLYDEEGETTGPRVVDLAEFFGRLGGEIVRLLSDHTEFGIAYRVDMRLRPDGEQGALARPLDATLGYYETSGRTWERQALIKCRPIAGDLELGRTFLRAIEPFVYRRYLSASEIAEIKAIKRRIEHRTQSAGAAESEVKTGRGGIRDVEFVVQFLQLLHGGEYPEVRHHNTLEALSRLEHLGCLSGQERDIMEDTYRFLRRVEHRLQTMFDLQTHELPRDPESLRILAIRMGYPPASVWEDRSGPAGRFGADYRAKTELNRRILNHLLHDAFRDEDGAHVDPVVDLVLDPDPTPEMIADALEPYPFRDRKLAYQNLMALAREDVPFLSQARCRHFLAAIAPRLLQSLGATPDPDRALTNLEKVSASLGAKAVLWELFSFNPPTMRLYVELCATSRFLTEVLVNNPGMIDDLMDSLVVDRPRPSTSIRGELAELCRGAEDLAPILLGFRNKEWVRIGSRDILGRESMRDVTRELADVAEAILGQAAHDQAARCVRRYGTPTHGDDHARSGWAILGFGKLGGRELSYHSDLDLVFVHEADGQTVGGPASISNFEFYSDLGRRVLKALDAAGPTIALYPVDTRLRPHGRSGPLVISIEAFRSYYRSQSRGWERLALTRARVVHASSKFRKTIEATLHEILTEPIDPRPFAREVDEMRRRLENGADRDDLKRAPGGLVDIEFSVRFLQLVHAHEHADLLRTNIWEALDMLRAAGLLDRAAHAELRDAYDFMRGVEARTRIIQNRQADRLPEADDDMLRLARRFSEPSVGPPSIEVFRARLDAHRARVREHYQRIVRDASEA